MPERAKPYHVQIADHYRDLIQTGKLQPGDRLPAKRQIATKFGCSGQPVTTALTRLEYEGLITGRQGIAYFVSDPRQ